MTDLRLPIGEDIFALRVGLLCQEGRRLLLNAAEDFAYLPGGAVQTGETLLEAARREWAEETGGPAGDLRFLGLIETFLMLGGQRWHELGFYFGMTRPAQGWPAHGTPLGDQSDHGMVWRPLSDLAPPPGRFRLAPYVPELLGVPAGGALHRVHRELPVWAGPDLRFGAGGVGVQVRVNLLHVRKGRLLACTEPGSEFWFLPGGTVRLGETLHAAALREWQEETGVPAEGAEWLGLSEGFDPARGRQQLSFDFRVECSAAVPDSSFPEQDGGSLRLDWVPLAEVDTLPVHPAGLSGVLSRRGGLSHRVIRWS